MFKITVVLRQYQFAGTNLSFVRLTTEVRLKVMKNIFIVKLCQARKSSTEKAGRALPLQSPTRCFILCHYFFLMVHTPLQFSAYELLNYGTKERFNSIDIPSYIKEGTPQWGNAL